MFLKKYIKALPSQVSSLPAKQMVRAELMTTNTAGIDTTHLTMFTMLLVSQTQHHEWTKLDTFEGKNSPSRAVATSGK